uniref:Hypothetical chloroplast RF54 n=1 Tax=Campylaephora sungminbooi TaxID=1896769 RepID=A0A1B0RRE8_9FLOR|nr:hypothetical chloroplast RF54 [Campylaephora sungminbooi]AKU47345.1 hypothetical chloroplast RF54 [Campylaephora sungminbooi]ALN11792.1 hypothetical chloroplast RF54 [Campylaephora sungminbooi]
MSYNYHFVIASQDFLVKEEPMEEILRERQNYYKSISKEIDFWFTLNPNFIDRATFDGNYIKLPKECAAIISLDKQFIQWLKLRIGFVAVGTFQSSTLINY